MVIFMENTIDFNKNLKILAIGNSFSVDAMEFLYQIADNYGVENIILGNLYIGGASLRDHVNELSNNLSDYIYYKNTDGVWNEKHNAKMLDGILDEEWDIITLQEASGYSGISEQYIEDLDVLIEYVQKNKTNPKAKLVWHMTWAYQHDSTHGGFVFYNNDQLTMYNAIVRTVKEQILSRRVFEYVIPTGTAIQNLRTSYLGDTLTIDGFHLSHNKGRFAAALCWFHKITGLSIDGITYRPDGVSIKDLAVSIEASKNAIIDPFKIKHTEKS